MKLSLGKKRKLSQKSEFRAFFNQAEVFRLGPCTIFRVPNTFGHFRLGITLKIKTNAVFRNKVRRAIRENIRMKAEGLGSFDYNVVVQKKGEVTLLFVSKLKQALVNWTPPRHEASR